MIFDVRPGEFEVRMACPVIHCGKQTVGGGAGAHSRQGSSEHVSPRHGAIKCWRGDPADRTVHTTARLREFAHQADERFIIRQNESPEILPHRRHLTNLRIELRHRRREAASAMKGLGLGSHRFAQAIFPRQVQGVSSLKVGPPVFDGDVACEVAAEDFLKQG